MRRYEVVFVLAPTLADDEFEQQIETYVEAAKESGAEVVDVDKWGKRRLAFPVQKHNDGFYTVLTLDEPSGKAVAELERRFKVNDAVIRFLSVRIDHELKRAEKFEKRKDARKKRVASEKAAKAKPADTETKAVVEKEPAAETSAAITVELAAVETNPVVETEEIPEPKPVAEEE